MKVPIVASGVQIWRIESASFLNGLVPAFAAPIGEALAEGTVEVVWAGVVLAGSVGVEEADTGAEDPAGVEWFETVKCPRTDLGTHV